MGLHEPKLGLELHIVGLHRLGPIIELDLASLKCFFYKVEGIILCVG
jgi:hypothetical protein